MKFSKLAKHLEKLEQTTSRNTMIELLAVLFREADAAEMDKLVYLLQGRIAPLYVALEFGMAEKQLLKALAFAYQVPDREVNAELRKIGDIGTLAEKLASLASESRRASEKKKSSDITVNEVFEQLKSIAETNGAGSVEKKMMIMVKLLKSSDPLSARFISRIPVAKLRLGFSDMTVLDALSWMVDGTKAFRREIEPVFNIRPDLGYIAKTVKEKGVKGLAAATPVVFTPVLMAKAERLSSGEEIINKIGPCAIEPKFDGFRLQAHKKGNEVKLFTRNLEDATFMYPDVVEGIRKQIKAEEAIFEGEAIAYSTETGEYLPFQETTQRKRKFDIDVWAKKIPLKLITFDLLYLNGENLIHKPYTKRREELRSIIKNGDGTGLSADEAGTVLLSEEKTIADPKEIETFFDDAISRGLEGILAKKLDGTYRAGARDWTWIKFKRSYSASLDDTLDCLVMGFYLGRGKRTAFGIGGFLIGVYDKKSDHYVTIARVGTGLTDDEWRTLATRGTKLKAKERPPLYMVDKLIEPDVWMEPAIVVEIRADELTRSTIHTAGRSLKPSKSGSAFDVDVPGYALRFPRLEKFRDDRKPEDVTELAEVEEMFENQVSQKNKKNGSTGSPLIRG